MKKQFKNIITLLLASAVLFASTGVVIASHICTSSKKSDVAFFENKGCCSKDSKPCTSFPTAPNSLKGNCCQLNISYHKIDVSSVQKTFSPVTIYYFPVKDIIALPLPGQTFFPAPANQNPDYRTGGKPFLFSIHSLLI